MRQGFQQSQRQDVALKVDPRVVLSSQVLQMNSMDLEQALEAELVENPALERHEAPEELPDHDVLRAVAPQEFQASGDSWEPRRSLAHDGEPTWMELLPATANLEDHLNADLLPRLPEALRPLGTWVIGCLDDRGYLAYPTEEIALDFGCSIEDVEIVLAQLHRCHPAGIGARTIHECLLLQLRGGNSVELKLARNIVRHYLEEYAARKSVRIARRYRVMPSVVECAFEIITGLTPFPAEGFQHHRLNLSRGKSVSADLIISRTEQGWEVEVNGLDPTSLGINRFYAARLEKLSHRSGESDREERRHLQAYVQRARTFIESVKLRRETMTRVGKFLIEQQAAFLTTGDYSFLRPLTRAKLADQVGVHESTISRATNGKFVQITTGEIVSFDVFFKASLRVQKMIEEILQTENPGNPLSDERISSLLAERGVHIARRTVSKYRDRSKNLSSRKRRVA
ncbi:MAG TPA: RNA polymerase factor sigma-54 [Fimbriimonadaceae bacterium]|nr:RNA polymerase factor sigma-54 [Fimbriimonadaceae bacterium]